jgi:hypothetical protein
MRAVWAALVLVLGAVDARAEQIPLALRGKSFILSWTSDKTQIHNSGTYAGQPYLATTHLSAKVYVSALGRIFSSYNENNLGSPGCSAVEEVSGGADNLLHWRFEGGALVGDTAFVQGARRIVVSSRDGFKTCSMSVIFGKKGGTEPLRAHSCKGSGPGVIILDYKISSTNCSVQQGNVFGGSQ